MKTVLIVEDEKMIRQGIKSMILRSGVPVEVLMECVNGEMALEILQNQKVDVMFTDIRMPKMDGIELVHKMQELEHIPLTVVVSGYDDFSYAVEMMRYGVREYLLKPVERQKIKEIMQNFEQELNEKQVDHIANKRMKYQQLKYLMMNEQVTEEELDTLEQEYGKHFDWELYYVCCLNAREVEKTREQYIYLHNIEGNDVYLVQKQNLKLLLKNELSEMYVGISGPHSGLKDVRKAYEEAREARKRSFCSCQSVVCFGEEQKQIPEALRKDAEKMLTPEARIQRVQLPGTEKTEEVNRVWKAFFAAVKMERIPPKDFDDCMEDFFREVRKTYRNLLGDEGNPLDQLEEYRKFMNLEEYEVLFMDWLLKLHEKINSQFDLNKNKKKIQQAVEYIKENYDKDLNMAVVSNYISMNYSLFSYAFKQYTGSNFVTYLKNIRMEEAKRLLVETDLRVNEISETVGYDNEKHFMKIFKSSCGVSPSEFRKNARLQ